MVASRSLTVLLALLAGCAPSTSSPSSTDAPATKNRTGHHKSNKPKASKARDRASNTKPKPRVDTNMSDNKKSIPTNLGDRVAPVLDEAVPAEIWLAYYHVSKGRSSATNFRLSIARDGALYYVRRGKKNKDWKIAFDKPLPSSPTVTLSKDELASIQAKIKDVAFFDHPGYESQDARGGNYDVVKVRREGKVHTVVYDNVSNVLVAYLVAKGAGM